MSNEIITYSDTEKAPRSTSRRLNLISFIRSIVDRPKNAPVEILLSNEEILRRVAILNVLIMEGGEQTVKLDKNRYCRVFINDKNKALEFRLGSKDQVAAKWFHDMTELEALVQVHFGHDGEVFEAVLGNLQNQATSIMGAGEYRTSGQVYGGYRFMRDVNALGAFTDHGPLRIPYTEEMKQNTLSLIFRPVNDIIWQLTEDQQTKKPSGKFNQAINR